MLDLFNPLLEGNVLLGIVRGSGNTDLFYYISFLPEPRAELPFFLYLS